MALQPARRRKVDVVAILDFSNQQVLAEAQFLRATVFDVAKLMEHPLEDGSPTADHIVFQPVEIDLPLMITGDNVKQVWIELRKLYLAGTKLVVQTRVDQYAPMILTEIPHDETPEAVDAITVSVRLREAVFVSAVYGGVALPPAKVKKASQASTAKKGAQQTTTAPATAKQKGSLLYQFSGLGKGG